MIAWTFFVFIFFLVVLIFTLLVWIFRSNLVKISAELGAEYHQIVSNNRHNAFTDLILFEEVFYLVHISSPSHFANRKSCVKVLCSKDFQNWEEIACLKSDGTDIRDPKICAIKGRLFIYALRNDSFDPKPNGTVYSSSSNGKDWSAFEKIDLEGWLLGRPKSNDNLIWIAPAHKKTFDSAALLRSQDGVHWQICSTVSERKGLDETAIEWLTKDSLIALSRYEPVGGLFGSDQDGTLVHQSRRPYEKWDLIAENHALRMDSPNLFACGERIFALGRFQPAGALFFQKQGSVFARKRTALFLIEAGKIRHLLDLPSAGDTAYAGVVVRGNDLFISYYSSPVKKDYPWIVGMLWKTGIHTARIDLRKLDTLSQLRSCL